METNILFLAIICYMVIGVSHLLSTAGPDQLFKLVLWRLTYGRLRVTTSGNSIKMDRHSKLRQCLK
jgi:hypothetical protein